MTTVEYDLRATMRDGVELVADAYRPAGAGPWPVLLARTPYGRRDPAVLAVLDPLAATRRGFLVVVQDVRGRHGSAGEWVPLAHEVDDGYDTVRWAARLPGADGTVATYGPSYLGHTALAALAADPPELVAAVPAFTWADPRDGLVARGGVPERGLVEHWTMTLGFDVLRRRDAGSDRLARLVEALDGGGYPADLDLPAPRADLAALPPGGARAAVLVVAGWFDAFLQGGLDTYRRRRAAGGPVALIVGPWSHGDQGAHVGGSAFGVVADAACLDLGRSLHDRQLDWLAGAHSPGVLVFVLGANEWRHLDEWPPPTREVAWYLREDGRLATDPPAGGDNGDPGCGPDSGGDSITPDAAAPVPTVGGALLLGPGHAAGPLDQAPIEGRPDVLVYTGDPLPEPVTVMGRIRASLAATGHADWVVRLCDVDPGGVSRVVTDGIVRAGAGIAHVVDLWSTAYVFRAGHRIRVQVTWSSVPRWAPHPAAGARPQRVYRDARRASHVVLPVLAAR